LDEVKNKMGIKIYIDFAHTPDSLEKALTFLKTKVPKGGRLISVFGCAGERDTKKRSKMGKISSQIADLSIFTAEDPRSEDTLEIIRAMRRYAKNYVVIPERGEAIAFALEQAKKNDVVAFLGKGHEKSMAYEGFEHPWSEYNEINNFLHKDNSLSAIVLAAGKGTRMKSRVPKILHKICGRPMISYSLQNLRRSRVGEIVVVVSYKRNLVARQVAGSAGIAVQKNPKGGTADAAKAALPLISQKAQNVMLLYGDDTAFYTPVTLQKVINQHIRSKATLTFITLMKDDPLGLGRIIRDEKGGLLGIVEEKDATDEQRKIREVNDGLYIFNKSWLKNNLHKIPKSPVTGEYYIVELIKLAIDQKKKVVAEKLPNASEWQGINNPEELVKATEKMIDKLKIQSI
jgi:bifunctional UDP-N-acetylglucosamine pyrophosphorylase / glucosamine-1-phosphate N-acetyltransferase